MSDASAPFLSFAKGLFLGWVQPSRIRPFPRLSEDEAETAGLLLDSFREWADEHLDGARFDREHAVPASVREGLSELGIMGLTVPEEHGGAGLGYGTYCRVMEETNRRCGASAVVLGGHQSIGIKALLLHGTEEQKAEWLPRLASGEWVAAYALTEPDAGSDPASLRTTADPTEDGAHHVLNGQKIWISNGGFADFITVFAKTPSPDGGRSITCFVLTPAEMGEGFSRGAEESKLGLRGSSTVQLFFDGLRVPTRNVLGRPGKGLKVALEVLNYGRASLAAGCAGASKAALEAAAVHAAERVQFGRPIAEFELIQAKLAEMAADTYATETIAYLTAGLADRGDADFSIEAAICKVFATEAHWRTCNHAVQVAGGIAYVDEYPYERWLRDARVNMIFEGTNEILHHFIALAGLREPGRALAGGVGDGAAALREHARALGGGTGAAGSFADLHEAVAPELAPLEALVEGFAAAVLDALRTEGDRLPEAELVQERLAGLAIDLYVAFACLARIDAELQDRGVAACEAELPVAVKAIRDAAARARRRLEDCAANDDELTSRVAGIVAGRAAWPFPLRT
jgi:acyl-CoA dehydrogenase family protein 9